MMSFVARVLHKPGLALNLMSQLKPGHDIKRRLSRMVIFMMRPMLRIVKWRLVLLLEKENVDGNSTFIMENFWMKFAKICSRKFLGSSKVQVS